MIKNVDYVVIPELPADQMYPFKTWMLHKDLLTVEAEGTNKNYCAWMDDYRTWLSVWETRHVRQYVE